MSNWLLRGLVFAALMVIVRLLQGALINTWETRAGLISIILVLLYAVAVFAWGLIDGRADARANPDPDRRGDLAMTWLLAGLFAGIVSGAVAWFISLFYKSLYVEGLINELTTFAAFTALLVFLMALAGVTSAATSSTATSISSRVVITASPSPPPTRNKTALTPMCSPPYAIPATRRRPTPRRPSPVATARSGRMLSPDPCLGAHVNPDEFCTSDQWSALTSAASSGWPSALPDSPRAG